MVSNNEAEILFLAELMSLSVQILVHSLSCAWSYRTGFISAVSRPTKHVSCQIKPDPETRLRLLQFDLACSIFRCTGLKCFAQNIDCLISMSSTSLPKTKTNKSYGPIKSVTTKKLKIKL